MEIRKRSTPRGRIFFDYLRWVQWSVKRKIKRDFGCNRKFTGNEMRRTKIVSLGIFPSGFDEEFERNGMAVFRKRFERIESMNLAAHKLSHVVSRMVGIWQGWSRCLMKADSISSICSPDRSVMLVSVLRIYDIKRKWRCTGVKRLKGDQSFRVDEMKVQTRSPCERTVEEKREKKKRRRKRRIDLIRRSLLQCKNCDFFLWQRRDTCREKKKYAYLSLRSTFYLLSKSERVSSKNTFNNRINHEEEIFKKCSEWKKKKERKDILDS